MVLQRKFILLAVAFALVPLVVYGCCYAQLPEHIATHFDFAGNADGFTHRDSLWPILLMPLGFVPLFAIIPMIDPKVKNPETLGKFYPAFVVGLTSFLATLMSAVVINALPGVEIPIVKLLPIFLGAFFIALGRSMPKIKQNHAMGVRTPWTLGNEVVWNKTHRVNTPNFHSHH